MKHIHFIPTYDENYKGENIHSKFLIKPNNGAASKNQIIKSGHIYEFISKYAEKYQIQEIIDIRVIYEIDFICKDGDIVGSIFHKTYQKERKTSDYFWGVNSIQTTNLPKGIIELCKNIIKDVKYNGFINFDFIKDVHGTVYIMECNPRLSGILYNPQYFKKLIEPYYNIKSKFCDHLIKTKSHDDDYDNDNHTEVELFNIHRRFYDYYSYKTKNIIRYVFNR